MAEAVTTDVLSALVIGVETERACTVPRTLGMALHAWFLDWLRSRDAALAAALHADNATRPFTISDVTWCTPLTPGPEKARSPMPSGAAGKVRITSLDPAVSRILREGIDDLEVRGYEFDGVRLRRRDVRWRNGADPDCGSTNVVTLLHVADECSLPRRLVVRFVSPTVFKQHGQFRSVPTPRLAFGSWLRRWNAVAPDSAWPDALVDEIDACVQLERGALREQSVAHATHRSRGGLGTCVYGIGGGASLLRQAHVLAAFAFWAGTGKSVAWGLGQTRPESPVLATALGGRALRGASR